MLHSFLLYLLFRQIYILGPCPRFVEASQRLSKQKLSFDAAPRAATSTTCFQEYQEYQEYKEYQEYQEYQELGFLGCASGNDNDDDDDHHHDHDHDLWAM